MKVVSKTFAFGRIVSWVWFGTKVIGGLALAAGVLLYINQDKLLYHPNPPGIPKRPEENPFGFSSPGEWATNGKMHNSRSNTSRAPPIPFEDVMVDTADGQKIHTWLMLQENAENCPTLIYFHGNAANMGFRLPNASEMYAKAKINILMVDYRGFGRSTGEPTERGLQLDAEAVLNYVKNHPRTRTSPVVVFGRSLGGAVSFYLAEKFPDQVDAVVVENTFRSVSAMVDILMPFLTYLKPFVLRIKWDSEELITRVRQPILFYSGDSDQLVPPSHMKVLYDRATQSVRREFYSVSGGTHNDTWEKGGEAYYLKLRDFLAPLFRRPPTVGAPPASTIGRREGSGEQTASAQPVNESGTTTTAGVDVTVDGTVEDDGFLVVNDESPRAAIPTMGTDFQVR